MKQLEQWMESLSGEEKIIVSIARATYTNFIVPHNATGMCYRLAMFLSFYLKEQHNIQTPAIIGYVNDGLGDIMISHAWIEYNNKKTDISLTISEHHDVVPTGALIILDREFSVGGVQYTYHYNQTQAGLQAECELFDNGAYKALVMRKRDEHTMMQSIAKDYDSQRAYLDAAPDGLNYERMAAIVESGNTASSSIAIFSS